MVRFLTFIALAVTGICAYGQEDRLILIDADRVQTFQVEVGGHYYTSSPIGHLLISGLPQGSYPLLVEFPNQEYPKHPFLVHLESKDLGLQLRYTGDSNWILYNWQTQEQIRANIIRSEPPMEKLPLGTKRNDDFARIMAGVVNDTLVMYTSENGAEILRRGLTPLPEKAGPDSLFKVPPEFLSGSPKNGSKRISSSPSSSEPLAPKPEVGKVLKWKESKSIKGIRSVYLVYNSPGHPDTIRIYIDSDTGRRMKQANSDSMRQRERGGFEKNPSNTKTPATVTCANICTDEEVAALHEKMAIESDVQAKISLAKKWLVRKCIRVIQVKMLIELFPNDNSRLQFYRAIHPHVADLENFGQLAESLSDPLMVSKFMTQYKIVE